MRDRTDLHERGEDLRDERGARGEQTSDFDLVQAAHEAAEILHEAVERFVRNPFGLAATAREDEGVRILRAELGDELACERALADARFPLDSYGERLADTHGGVRLEDLGELEVTPHEPTQAARRWRGLWPDVRTARATGDLLGARAGGRVDREQIRGELAQIERYPFREGVGEWGRRRLLCLQHVRHLSGERERPDERFEQHDTERVAVGGRPYVARDLLGRHVHRSPHEADDLGRRARHARLVAYDAEVEQRGASGVRDDHVGRLDVAVHDPGRVEREEGICHLTDAVANARLVEPFSPPHEGAKIHPGEEIHREKPLIAVGEELSEADDVRVSHALEGTKLALESDERIAAPDGQELQRDPHVMLSIDRFVHGARRAGADAAHELEAISQRAVGRCDARGQIPKTARPRIGRLDVFGAVDARRGLGGGLGIAHGATARRAASRALTAEVIHARSRIERASPNRRCVVAAASCEARRARSDSRPFRRVGTLRRLAPAIQCDRCERATHRAAVLGSRARRARSRCVSGGSLRAYAVISTQRAMSRLRVRTPHGGDTLNLWPARPSNPRGLVKKSLLVLLAAVAFTALSSLSSRSALADSPVAAAALRVVVIFEGVGGIAQDWKTDCNGMADHLTTYANATAAERVSLNATLSTASPAEKKALDAKYADRIQAARAKLSVGMNACSQNPRVAAAVGLFANLGK